MQCNMFIAAIWKRWFKVVKGYAYTETDPQYNVDSILNVEKLV